MNHNPERCNWDDDKAGIQSVLNEVRLDVKSILQSIAELKVKAGVWGLIGGAIPVLIVVILYLCFKG